MQNGASADCGCDDSRCFPALAVPGVQGPVGHDALGCLIPYNPDTCVANQQVKLAHYEGTYAETDSLGDVYGPGTDGSGWYTRASMLWQPNFTAAMTAYVYAQVDSTVDAAQSLGTVRVMVDGVQQDNTNRWYMDPPLISRDTHLSMFVVTLTTGPHNVQLQYEHRGAPFTLKMRAMAWRTDACPVI